MAMQRRIESEVQEEISKTNMSTSSASSSAIQKELGELDAPTADLLAFRECIDATDLPAAVEQECRKQLARLERLHLRPLAVWCAATLSGS
jgi:ATP-dependent Lon protease